MENKVLKTIKKYNMLSHGDTVVLGFSGGADSCAMFSIFLGLREEYELKLIVCHINHMLRDEEADRDEEFVRKMCEKNNVSFRLLKTDVAEIAKQRRESTEKCGRDIRYSFFRETALMYNGKIATAHTASDNAETVLFNLTRGCGVRGLGGIPPVRDNIIRPLIEVTREEIEKYCNDNKINYVTDSSNLTRDYTRNKIRLDAVKVFKQINPSFEQTIARMSEQMRGHVLHINNTAREILDRIITEKGCKVKELNACDDAIFSEIIYILASEYDVVPEAVHIGMIRQICRTSGAVELKSKIFAVSKQGYLRIIKRSEETSLQETEYDGQKSIVINNKKITFSLVNIDEFNNRKKNYKLVFDNSLDYDTISLPAVFRSRKSGDFFRLPKRNVTKPLKKLFCEMKIPQEQRNSVLVFACGSDVMWIEGAGVSDDHRVTKDTKKVLIIETKEHEEVNHAQ